MNRWRRSPQRDLAILAAAHQLELTCIRDRHLNPQFVSARPGFHVEQADHDQILRYVLNGLLRYERLGPHYFGVGHVQLTPHGSQIYQDMCAADARTKVRKATR